jgi:hypothetical protein
MRTTVALACAFATLSGGLLSGCSGAGGTVPGTPRDSGQNGTVRAQRYHVFVGDGFYGAMRGVGSETVELYFPDQGVVANVQWDFDEVARARGTLRDVPVVHAWYGPSRYSPYPVLGQSEAPPPPEEVRVPRDVADLVFAAAERRREMGRVGLQAGGALVAAGLFPNQAREPTHLMPPPADDAP